MENLFQPLAPVAADAMTATVAWVDRWPTLEQEQERLHLASAPHDAELGYHALWQNKHLESV
jgi:hypothetical protein